jgi:ATP-dependent Clp protease protease subunit
MIPGDPPPEIPMPGTRPGREAPVHSPTVVWPPPDDADDDLSTRLRRDRRLLMRGTLDDETCTRASAELMLLDGTSADPVEVLISSDGGPVEAVTGLLDVLSLMRARVDTRCIGGATGTAAVLLASGTGTRTAGPTARVSLRIADHYDVHGTAADLALRAEEAHEARQQLAERLSDVSSLTTDEAHEAFDRGELLVPATAVEAGIIDSVAHR